MRLRTYVNNKRPYQDRVALELSWVFEHGNELMRRYCNKRRGKALVGKGWTTRLVGFAPSLM